MEPAASIAVTLPAAVLDRLRREAAAAGVPVQWAVAAFIAALDG